MAKEKPETGGPAGSESPGEEYEVTVLRRQEISVYPKLGQEVKKLMITYTAAGLPPATITMDKDKHTPEKEKVAIRADIETRLKEKPETFKV